MTGLPLNIDWQQILLHLFNFAILAIGLTYFLYRPVQDFMNKRKAYYEDIERQAAEKERHAHEMEYQYEKRLSEANEEIHRHEVEESTRIAQEIQAQMEEAKSQAKRIVDDARKEAQAAKARILESTQKDITDMVVSSAAKLLLENHSTDSDRALYDQFLSLSGKDLHADGK